MAVDTENEVKITRGKKRLEQIRSEGENGRGIVSSRRHVETRTGSDVEIEGSAEGSFGGSENGARGFEEGSRFSEGLSEGVRSSLTENEYPASGPGEDSRRYEAGLAPLIPEPRESPEEKAERERELHRQRQKRYAERKKAEQGTPIASPILESEHESSPSRPRASFSLKLPGMRKESNPEKSKLFSNKEADAELEKMTAIYQQGASLIDDLLEVIVKDHEPVQIWALSDEEAEMLAEMHLERAKTDPGAARSARVLLSLYDRLYRWLIAGPRMKASYSHVKAHGGFSFK